MSALTLSARLDRSDPNTPWGFRMAGGKDFNQPLTIQRVTPGSLAAKCGLQVGDAITKIGGMPTSSLKHKDAQGCIMQGGNSVEITLQRGGGSFSRPQPPPVEPSYEPSQPAYSAPPSSWDPKNYPPSSYQSPQAQNQNYNTAPKPFTPAAGTMPVAVNKQYNTPINMYSVDNVMDSLATQTAGINMGGQGKLEDSDVYKLVHAEENGKNEENVIGNNNVPDTTQTPPSPMDAAPPPINHTTFPSTKPAPNAKPASLSEPRKASVGVGKTPPTMSARYQEVEGESPQYKGYTNPGMQSRSFKLLQGLVDSGEDVTSLSVGKSVSPARSPVMARRSSNSPHLMGPKPYSSPSTTRKALSSSPNMERRAPSPLNNNSIFLKPKVSSEVSPPEGGDNYVKAISNTQYNSPIGLYGQSAAKETFEEQSKLLLDGRELEADPSGSLSSSTASAESGSSGMTSPPRPDSVEVSPARQTLTVSPQRATITVSPKRDTITVTPDRKKIVVSSPAKPVATSFPPAADEGKKVYRPSDTFRLVQEEDGRKGGAAPDQSKIPSDTTDGIKISSIRHVDDPESSPYGSPLRDAGLSNTKVQSRSFRMLEQQLDNQAPGPAAMGSPSRPSPAAPRPQANLAAQRPQPAAAAPRPAPAAAPAPSGGAWKPQLPTGPRNMKLGRAGEAKTFTTPQAGKIPICSSCGITIRGPFILALDRSWCPDHFNCSNPNCRRPLVDCGFVEEEGQLFCEADYRQFFAPRCAKCGEAIIGEIVNALNATYHMDCFLCSQCSQPIGKGSFHTEDGKIYCQKDWQSMFQTKCHGCDFPIEPGDRWVEALNYNWHSECFNCSSCQMSLEGQSFFAKSGKPYCKKHAMGKK